MGDMFGSWVPDLWVTRVFRVIWDHAPGYGRPEHQFQILTKFPQNIPYFSAISAQDYKVPEVIVGLGLLLITRGMFGVRMLF